jgi:prephenate dehydrogenase
MQSTIDDHLFNRLAILGLGLIGGSFALAAKEQNMAKEIVAFDPNVQSIADASIAGIIEQGFSNAQDAVKYADGIILAAPVRAILSLLPTIAPFLSEGAFVMVLGSTKCDIVSTIDRALPAHVRAVGGHPMAGKELSGFRAAEATLFVGATFALCPSSRTDQCTRTLAEQIVTRLGARPLWTDALAHDNAVARISHLPYLLSATLTHAAAPQGLSRQLAASGYRDTSRLAGSDPTMILNILLTNAPPIRAAIADARTALNTLDELLDTNDEAGLRHWMKEAQRRR